MHDAVDVSQVDATLGAAPVEHHEQVGTPVRAAMLRDDELVDRELEAQARLHEVDVDDVDARAAVGQHRVEIQDVLAEREAGVASQDVLQKAASACDEVGCTLSVRLLVPNLCK